ncbi:hypothetical protein ACH5RR_029870 [Cinchona calisaya]|uniref:Uncharacterized protein n=1 Tax=Cinchona calisaya TaxID=153742 RepID=A0ABD2YUE0_9GENT
MALQLHARSMRFGANSQRCEVLGCKKARGTESLLLIIASCFMVNIVVKFECCGVEVFYTDVKDAGETLTFIITHLDQCDSGMDRKAQVPSKRLIKSSLVPGPLASIISLKASEQNLDACKEDH